MSLTFYKLEEAVTWSVLQSCTSHHIYSTRLHTYNNLHCHPLLQECLWRMASTWDFRWSWIMLCRQVDMLGVKWRRGKYKEHFLTISKRQTDGQNWIYNSLWNGLIRSLKMLTIAISCCGYLCLSSLLPLDAEQLLEVILPQISVMMVCEWLRQNKRFDK